MALFYLGPLEVMTLSLCYLLLLYFELRVVVVSSAGDILLAYFWTRPTKGHWTISQMIKSKGVLWQSRAALRLPQAFPPSKNRFIKQREYLECALHIGLPLAPTDARHKKRQPRDNQTFLSRFEDNIPHRNKRLVGENLHQKACIIRKALHRGKRVQDSGQCPILSSSHFIGEDCRSLPLG